MLASCSVSSPRPPLAALRPSPSEADPPAPARLPARSSARPAILLVCPASFRIAAGESSPAIGWGEPRIASPNDSRATTAPLPRVAAAPRPSSTDSPAPPAPCPPGLSTPPQCRVQIGSHSASFAKSTPAPNAAPSTAPCALTASSSARIAVLKAPCGDWSPAASTSAGAARPPFHPELGAAACFNRRAACVCRSPTRPRASSNLLTISDPSSLMPARSAARSALARRRARSCGVTLASRLALAPRGGAPHPGPASLPLRSSRIHARRSRARWVTSSSPTNSLRCSPPVTWDEPDSAAPSPAPWPSMMHAARSNHCHSGLFSRSGASPRVVGEF